MNPRSRDNSAHDGLTSGTGAHTRAAVLSPELLALLRHRVATRFYDDPRVIDAVARAIVRR